MSAIWMRVRSELRTGKRSILGLALLIALAGAAVLGPLAGARRTDSAYDRFLAESNVHDVETNEGVPGLGYNYRLDLSAAAALPQVDQYEISRLFIIGLHTGTLDVPVGGEAVVIRPEGSPIGKERLISGRFPRADRSDEVAVGYGTSVRDGIGVGDTLTLDLPSATVLTQGLANVEIIEQFPVKVVGVILLPGAVPPAIRYGQLYATTAFAERFQNKAANAQGIYVKLKRGVADIPAYRAGLERLAEGGSVQFLTGNDQHAGVRRSIDVYVVALQAFAGLAAVAAILILTQMLARQLSLGADDNPALRSLGMTSGQIALAAMVRTAIAAVAGVAAAVVIAYALTPLFPIGTARVVEPSPGPRFDLTILGGGAVALLFLVLTFSLPAAWSAGRRASLSDTGSQPEGQASPSRLAGWISGAGGPASVVAGVRLALERGRGRSAMPVLSTIVASAAAVASIVTLVAFGTSMGNLTDTPRLFGWNWDALAGNPYAPDLGDQVNPVLERSAEIREYSSGATNVRVLVSHGERRSLDIQALALTPRRGDVLPPLLQGRWPNDDDEVTLGTNSMRSLGVSLGDTVEISVADDSIRAIVVGRSVFPIVGDQYGGELGRGVGFTLEGLRRVAPDSLENIFPVRFQSGIGFASLPSHLRDLFFFDDAEGSPNLGIKPTDLENLSKVRGAPLALVGLVALLGVATMAHALATSVRRRRRDLAILKTMGFVKRQIRAAVATQATTLALVALAFGIPVGLIAGRAAWLAFANRQGVVPEAIFASWPVFALIPATLLLANLIAALPGRAAARVPAAAVLRTE